MRRDGIAFVALMLFIAWITNTLSLIFSAAFSLIGIFAVGYLIVAILRQKPQIVNGTVTYYPHTIRENNLPPEFKNIEALAFYNLNTVGDTARTISGKFLGLIGITNGSAVFPDYLHNAVAKKLMWEYYQKFGNLQYAFDGTHKLSYQEAIRPVPDAQKADYHLFCQQHTI